MKIVALITLLQILLCLIHAALGGGHLRSLKKKPLTLHSAFVGAYVNIPGTTGAAITLNKEKVGTSLSKPIGVVYLVATRFEKGNALPAGDLFANSNTFTFTFDNALDTIVVSGVWKGTNPSTLAIVGGTGRYNGANGYATIADGGGLLVTTYTFFFN